MRVIIRCPIVHPTDEACLDKVAGIGSVRRSPCQKAAACLDRRATGEYGRAVMPHAHLPTASQRSNAFARARDARICWLLDMHPVTAAMLVQIGLFPSKNKALKRLNRLVRRKRIRLVGTVCQKAGRPENVYGRWHPKVDHLLHEVQLTQMCFRLDAERILRGPHVLDAEILPDAEVWINGEVYYLEWDRGTIGYTQIVRNRFRKYESCPHLALWICPTEVRREGLRTRAESIRGIALFTTAGEALASPHRDIWIDYQGKKAALPRQRRGKENPGEKQVENP